MTKVKKRNGSLEDFKWEKIDAAVEKAFKASKKDVPDLVNTIVHETVEMRMSNIDGDVID